MAVVYDSFRNYKNIYTNDPDGHIVERALTPLKVPAWRKPE
jgi:hypothetical protein